MQNTAHTLYWLAERADRRYSEVIKSRTGKTRWTLSPKEHAIPEIADAYRAKRNADEAWSAFLRFTRNSA